MKKGIAVVFALLPLFCNGQDNSDITAIKQEAEIIFSNLVESIGNTSLPEPKLTIRNSKKSIAEYVPKENVIYFEMEAYRLCKQLGDDNYKSAIAFILAHELAHRYKEHGWTMKFGSSYGDIEVWKQIVQGGTSKEQLIRDETQADLFAGFFCHVSGYNALPIVPRLLDLLYTEYNLPVEMRGYPSLAERKEISNQSLEMLRKLTPVFDAANLALVTGDNDIAIQCYEHILNSNFSSREIYNNLGIAYCRKALTYFEPAEMKYVYPFEFDAETRLEAATRSVSDEEEKLRTELLQKSLKYFKKSVALDENYPSAYLNIACVSEILDEKIESDYHLNKYRNIHPDSLRTQINVLLLKGIMEARAGNFKSAEKYFSDGICKNNYAAELNLKILYKIPLKQKEPMASVNSLLFDGIQLQTVSGDYFSKSSDTIIVNNVGIYKRELPNSEIFLMTYKNRRQHIVQVAKSGCKQELSGIKLLDYYNSLIARFGEPEKIISSTAENYYYYFSGKLIFRIDAANKVAGWILVS